MREELSPVWTISCRAARAVPPIPWLGPSSAAFEGLEAPGRQEL